MVEVVSPLASGYFWERSIYSFQPSITSFSFLGYQLSSIFHEGCRVYWSKFPSGNPTIICPLSSYLNLATLLLLLPLFQSFSEEKKRFIKEHADFSVGFWHCEANLAKSSTANLWFEKHCSLHFSLFGPQWPLLVLLLPLHKWCCC